MNKDLLKGLTEDQIKKVKACKNPEEILALAKAEGIELNEEQLEAVSGGCGGSKDKKPKCPFCKKTDTVLDTGWGEVVYYCTDCNREWRP